MFVYQNLEQSRKHFAQPGNYECPQRAEVVSDMLNTHFPRLEQRQAPLAADEQLQLLHSPQYLKRLAKASRQSEQGSFRGVEVGEETLFFPGSMAAARGSAGAVIEGVDQIARALREGRVIDAFSLSRPPGHHAQPKDSRPETGGERAMGFCPLSNVALGAVHALKQHGLRPAIFDFDVHNGNGTWEAVRGKDEILFTQIYMTKGGEKSYPYEGQWSLPEESSNVVSVGLEPGTTATAYMTKFKSRILTAVKRHGADLLFLSAGFDSMKYDPVGGLLLQPRDIETMVSSLRELTLPIFAVLEGGYHRNNLYDGSRALVEVLSKRA